MLSTFSEILGNTTFSPIKNEAKGLIRSIEAKHSSNANAFSTVSKIVEDETNAKTMDLPNSATSALKWLVRHWMFVHYFLHIFVESQNSTKDCLKTAYESTLMKFHDQVIQSVFAVSLNFRCNLNSVLPTIFDISFRLPFNPHLQE